MHGPCSLHRALVEKGPAVKIADLTLQIDDGLVKGWLQMRKNVISAAESALA